MPTQYMRFERLPSTSRGDFALAALQFCRTRRTNPKVTNARYHWADAGNTMVVLTEGEAGAFDYEANPDPDAVKALYAMHDVARNLGMETWADADLGATNWRDVAGAPSGVAD